MVRGIGFFELMAAMSPADPRFAKLSAGMLVVRTADTLLQDGHVDARAFRDLQREVAYVLDLPARVRLTRIVSAIGSEDIGVVSNELFLYGLALHEMGFFSAAGDIFALLSGSHRVPEPLRLQALLRQGFELRIQGKLDEAALAYEETIARARRERRHQVRLEAELSLAKITADRGDMPRARNATRLIARAARRSRFYAIYGKACVDLSRLAGIANEPLEVLRYATLALEHLTEADPCERARANVAQALRELGAHDAAFRYASRIAETAEGEDQRANAMLLLYHLAIDARDWPEAERLRRTLARLHLTPCIAGEYYEAVARDAATRGDFDEAMLHAHRMLAVAESERLNEIAARAETAIAALARGDVPSIYQFVPAPPKTPLGRKQLRRFVAAHARAR